MYYCNCPQWPHNIGPARVMHTFETGWVDQWGMWHNTQGPTDEPPPAKQGWECPRCGKVHAPWVQECDCHRSTSAEPSRRNVEWITYWR
jgi:hypothetical protein